MASIVIPIIAVLAFGAVVYAIVLVVLEPRSSQTPPSDTTLSDE